MAKPGIVIDIPGFSRLEVKHLVTDYTGTHSLGGALVAGSKEKLQQLSKLVDIHVLTSDTFGTVRKQLVKVDHTLRILEGQSPDQQKAMYVDQLGPSHIAAFGNGRNDRLMLTTVKAHGGLAVAVDNGEGCALEAILAAHLFCAFGSPAALDLLLETQRLKATLRS